MLKKLGRGCLFAGKAGVAIVLLSVLGGWKLLFGGRRYRYGRAVGGGRSRRGYRGSRRRR